MAFGMEVGLSPGDFVLDGNPASPSPKEAEPSCSFRLMSLCLLRPNGFLLWRNGWMDQDGTWHGGRPHPRRLCVTWEHSLNLPKKEAEPPFSAYVYCGQTAAWIKMPLGTDVGLGPDDIVLDEDRVLPKKGMEPSSPILLWPNGWMDQDGTIGMEVGLGPGHIVLDGETAPLPQKGGRAPPQFSAHFYCDKRLDASSATLC